MWKNTARQRSVIRLNHMRRTLRACYAQVAKMRHYPRDDLHWSYDVSVILAESHLKVALKRFDAAIAEAYTAEYSAELKDWPFPD